MNIMKKNYCLFAASFFFALSLSVSCSDAVIAPEPVLPVPEPQQVRWQQMERYAFIHYGLNTYADAEWGYGNVSPELLAPEKLDCRQWARVLAGAGMKGIIITAKHHDGFCLWPCEETDYDIASSPYRDGKGDIVRELSEACREYSLKFGVYVSPWDRNRSDYGREEYVGYYRSQLESLLSGDYGEIFEVWLDGANGGDGWYGGADETRTIDRMVYYDFPSIDSLILSLQPDAIIFSDGGPGCRWVGNERGVAGETNWSFLRGGEVYPGYHAAGELPSGHEDGDTWIPAECDVSIRPGWFWHADEDSLVKSPEQLLDLYFKSVGRNANLLLNVPVNRDGLISKADSASLHAFNNLLSREFGYNVLKDAVVEASSERGRPFRAENLVDGDYDTFWSVSDSCSTPSVRFSFVKPEKLDKIVLQEYIPLGQRVVDFDVEYLSRDGVWMPVDCGEQTTTIGYKRIVRFRPIETEAVRVVFRESRGPVCISAVEAYLRDYTQAPE